MKIELRIIEQVDSLLYDTIKAIGLQVGYTVYPIDDFSNQFITELRNQILEGLEDNFNIERLKETVDDITELNCMKEIRE